MSKFLVVVPNCLPATQQIVTKYFSSDTDWWHWSPDVWLLRFGDDRTAAALRDEMRVLLPNVYVLVMKFESQHWEWAGYGPMEWTEWFRTGWEGQT